MRQPTWRTKLELLAEDGYTVVGHVSSWTGHPGDPPAKRRKWRAELMVGRTKGQVVLFDGRRFAIEYVRERYRQYLETA